VSERRARDYLARIDQVAGPQGRPAPGEHDRPLTSPPPGQGPAVLPVRPTYVKTGLHLTLTHRDWLRAQLEELGDPALSMSDLVRLAVARLAADSEAGRVDLAGALFDQAVQEVTAGYAGRLQRGMPRGR
jgi:hypothetical protein